MMTRTFNTSQRVTILGRNGEPEIRGAIVRSFNEQTGEYYLTYRDAKGGLQVYYVLGERLRAED